MDSSKVRNASKAALLLLMVLAHTGCSSTRLAYRYADWGIIWWVEDFITLTAAQKQQLETDIDELRQWHCSTELPRYRSLLQSLQNDLATGPPEAHQVRHFQNDLMALLPPLLEKVTPIAVNLLASLNDEQVRELASNMAKNHREMEEEFLAGDAEKVGQLRAERTAERAERWLGSLNSAQQRVIKDWSENRSGQTEIWLEGRRNWQNALLHALENRHEPGFEGSIAELINNPTAARGTAYARMMDSSTAAMALLIQDLLHASYSTHLEHLVGRASKLRSDFKALSCQPGSEIASRQGG